MPLRGLSPLEQRDRRGEPFVVAQADGAASSLSSWVSAAAISLRLVSKMSRQIAGGPPAMRVMSRNPGPAAPSTPLRAATA